jgi:prophage regulatory protein
VKLLSYDDLRAKGIPFSRVHLWRLEKEGRFPKRVSLGESKRVWVECEIDQWIEQRMASRKSEAA